MPVFKIHHITKYKYEFPVAESINEIRMIPYPCPEQELLQQELNISHHPDLHNFTDYWGNRTAIFSLLESHSELVLESKLIIRTTLPAQLQINFHSSFEQLEEEKNHQLQLWELSRAESIRQQSEIESICQSMASYRHSVALMVEKCSEYVFKNFKYTKGITTIETTVDEILEHKGGVCQDFAHLLLQMLRSLSIPCRYVSGYICPNKNGMRGEGATHAWVDAWIPGYGWAGIDPTNNIWTTNNHIKLAVGRNFNDCTPIKGTFKGLSRQDLQVFVSVGYEDGHVFQETTQVQMQKEQSYDSKKKEEEDALLAQQQQQQQQ
jgi:transglutaminase-like putative cysteine protease